MIKAVFFDVDGTLFSHTMHQVPESTRSAICKLKRHNIQCVVATGRQLAEMEKLPVTGIDFDGYITLNGQLCLDGQRNVLKGNPITGSSKDRIIRLFEEKKIPIILAEQDSMYINFVNRQVALVQQAISSALPEIGSYTGNDIYQAIAYIGKEEEDSFQAVLEDCKMTRWNDYAVDIISRRGGKTSGIREYLAQSQIPRSQTMAFGDGENDIEMLRYVQIGVAMGNASPEVKAAADYVTETVDRGGIENALKHFGLIE